VPPLPAENAKSKVVLGILTKAGAAEKVAGSDQVAEFFNHRQSGLQLFLSRVAAHGELSSSQLFSNFVSLDQTVLSGYKKQVKDAQKSTKSVGKWIVKKKLQLAERKSAQQAGWTFAQDSGNGLLLSKLQNPDNSNLSEEDAIFFAVHETIKQFKDPAERLKSRTSGLPAHGDAMHESFKRLSKSLTECSLDPSMEGIAKWAPAFDLLVRSPIAIVSSHRS
jgi:hypothetical protein